MSQYAYALRVRYEGCTNFEGEKILVFIGQCLIPFSGDELDPHFISEDYPLIARFRPDEAGWQLAKNLVNSKSLVGRRF